MFRIVAALLLLCTAVAPETSAFHAVPMGLSVHDEISSDAAHSLQFPTVAVLALKQATRRPDYDDGKASLAANGTLVLKITDMYRASHHCDRIPPTSDAEAFRAASYYVDGQRREALLDLGQDDPQAAVAAIGRALHALQDCFAHSNAVTLGEETLLAYEEAVVHNGTAPPGLRITGFDPDAPYNMAPPGDDYPYSTNNLDAPNATAKARSLLPDGTTQFEKAKGSAIVASRMFLSSILDAIPQDQKEALMGSHSVAPPGHLPIPSAGLPVALGAVVCAALLRKR